MLLKKIKEKVKNSWAFAVAAASLPISYLLLTPCFGAGCAACPSGGACLLSAPLLILLVIMAKSFGKIKNAFGKFSFGFRKNSQNQQKTEKIS